ncbi:choice-of-anchor L domain-containing protein [Flavobacterium sp. I3-2]|uniref:choice-of-anchor L domain-containing protein n=1 Tax=Flavobacterium sp. I3-2 TaxID=2748319 RepID=UPI0015A83D7E|nr:choice-of-anchor L domain-containing protein [Flavobacterium sp. I3-2]
MKKYLLLCMLLSCFWGISQPITVSTTQYTVEELITEVLINTPCAEITNITWKNGNQFGSVNSIGSFTNTNPNFPMASGIVLSSGAAMSAPGPYGSSSQNNGNAAWVADTQLTNYMNDYFQETANYHNASVIEFDFRPFTDEMSFNFLFASQEYGGAQCFFSDSFAFFLTNTETGEVTNLALLPGTNIPVSVVTIRDSQYNDGCESENVEYFGSFNQGDPNSVLNYSGQTVKLTAASEVSAGVLYHIKLVIQDRTDFILDSAVFIEGGSFDIGMPNLGENRLKVDGSAMCAEEEYELSTGLNPDQYLFQWTKDGELIPGATGATYTVTEAGLYGVMITAIFGACEQNPEPVLIEFFDELEISNLPKNLNSCPTIGASTIFNLKDSEEGVTNEPVIFSYFLTEEDAKNNENSISSTYLFDNNDTEPVTIWVRITGLTIPCSRVESFTIALDNCTLQLEHLPDMSVCIGAQPNSFDFNPYKNLVYHGIIGYTVTFYHSEEDAQLQTNPIDNNLISNYTATDGETIWVRVQDDSDVEIFGIQSFNLYLYDLPVVNTPEVLRSCEVYTAGFATFDLSINQNAIVGDQTNIALQYYRTYAEAEIGDVATSLPLIYSGPQGDIFIRVINQQTGCYIIVTQPLQIVEAPVLAPVAPLEVCDVNNDGFAVFNLIPTTIIVTENPVPADLLITYHETLADANNNANKIQDIGAYQNTVANNQTIYVRVTRINSKCFATMPIMLKVKPTPNISNPTPLHVCDSDNNGIADFDLTSKKAEILNGLDPLDYIVTYYTNEVNANAGTNDITNPASYSNLTSNIVFVRVEGIGQECAKVVRLVLITDPTPVVANPVATYSLCDDNFDGFQVFDLASKIPVITGSQTGLQVTFHYSLADANSGSNPLASPYQNVVQNVQTLHVRVQRLSTGCFTTTTMDIRVTPIPVLNIPIAPIDVCSNTDSSFGTINLTSYNAQFLNGGPAYELKYFETQANAQNNVLPILGPEAYNNLQPSNPSVWVRATNPQTGCFSVYKVTFRLLVSPKMPVVLPDVVTCDVHADLFDGITPINLAQQTPLILAAQTIPGTYEVRYFTSLVLANVGTNWIANPETYLNTSNPQTIWVRVQNAAHPTSCFEVKSFNVVVNTPLPLGLPSPIALCDNGLPNDGQTTFDLTMRQGQITQGQIFGVTLKYYTNEAEAKAGFNHITNPTSYVNTSNPQTIWVSVENMHGCFSYTTLTIRVLPLPEPNLTPTALQKCETALGSGEASFDLRLAQPDLSNGNATLTYKYFITEQEAINNVGAIGTPEDFLTGSMTVYVRVSNTPTILSESCFVIVPLQLIVNSLPTIGTLTPLLACELNTDGIYTFDLRDKDPQVLGNQNPANFDVRYYVTETAALLGAAPIPYIYTNAAAYLQTIWVRVQHRVTGCYSIASLDLKVEEKVFAYPPSVSLAFCDTDGVNDGFGPADITTLNAGIISTQNLTGNLGVRYYSSWANYNAGNASSSTQFPITSNPQLVIAEVFNLDNEELCTATVQFFVTMSKAPSFEPIPNGYVCTDFRTGRVNGYLMDTELPAGQYTFTWMQNGNILANNGPSHEATAAGNYTVTVTSNETGCSVTQTINVQVAPAVSIDEIKISEGFSETNVVEVIASATPGTLLEYAMDEGAYQDSNIFVDVAPGTHIIWVKVKGLNACATSKVINVLNYPKFFTPNNDGYNDTWNIFALKDQPEAKIYIFDRQGKLLKQLSPAGEGWDGTFNNKPLPSTDYWFKAEYIEPNTGLQKEATGHFTLKR